MFILSFFPLLLAALPWPLLGSVLQSLEEELRAAMISTEGGGHGTLAEVNALEMAIVGSVLLVVLVILLILQSFISQLRKRNAEIKEVRQQLEDAQAMLEQDQKLEELGSRIRETLAGAPVAYILAVDGRILETNDYCRDRLGALEGLFISRIFARHDDFLKIDQQLHQENTIIGATPHINTIDGSAHRFYANITRVMYQGRPALVLWGVDIEENFRQKEILQRLQNELLRMADAVPLPLAVIDPRSTVLLYANQTFADVFGFSQSKDVSGLSLTQLLKTPFRETTALRVFLRNAAACPLQEELTVEVNLPGGERSMRLCCSPLTYYQDSAVVCAIWDMTESRWREEQLSIALDREREGSALKNGFLAQMGREFHKPINAIIGMSNLTLRQEQAKADRMRLKKINLAAMNLLSIMNSILDYSRMETENPELTDEAFWLSEVLSSSTAQAAQWLDDRPVHVDFMLEPDVPLVMSGDKTRLGQTLKNVMGNAVKYTDAGEVLLTARMAPEQPQDRGHLALLFEIRDTGFGMTQSMLDRLFIPFEHFHTSKRPAGSGLGMSVAKQLVELMGGTIDVESEPDKGTTVRILLPFGRCGEAALRKNGNRYLYEPCGTYPRARVLLEGAPLTRMQPPEAYGAFYLL